MARWMLYLSEFDIKLIHIPGKKNIQADALSRRPDLCPEGTDNENVIVLPEHLFANLIDTELQWLKKMSQCLHNLERSAWCNLLT